MGGGGDVPEYSEEEVAKRGGRPHVLVNNAEQEPERDAAPHRHVGALLSSKTF